VPPRNPRSIAPTRSLAACASGLRRTGPAIAEVIVGVQYFAAHAHVANWQDLEPVDWEKAIELMRADAGVEQLGQFRELAQPLC
jgi:hypothetical protein